MKSQSESYKEAGVDITSGYRAVELMKEHVGKTMQFGNTAPVGGVRRTVAARSHRHERANPSQWNRWRGNKAQACFPAGQARHGGDRLRCNVC